MAAFDAKADTPVASTAVASGDKFPFGDISADGWDTITAAQLLDALLLVATADASGSNGVLKRVANRILGYGGFLVPSGTSYTSLESDGTTVHDMLVLDGNNSIRLDNGNRSTFVAFGGVATANRSGGSPLLTAGRQLFWETWWYDDDIAWAMSDAYNGLFLGNAQSSAITNTMGDVRFGVETRRNMYWLNAMTRVMELVGGRLGVRPGSSTGYLARVGGCLFDHFADGASTHTDGTEDDLYSDSVDANVLAANGDKLHFDYGLSLAGHATATRKLKVYFGGTAIFDSTAQVTASASAASVRGTLIRDSSTSIRYRIDPNVPGMVTPPKPAVGSLTGLTLSAANVLKITGAAAATGAAGGDITAKIGTVSWSPASVDATNAAAGVPLTLKPWGWWKANAGTYLGVYALSAAASANNDVVVLWEDQSGNGRHFTQVRQAASAPLLKTNSLNSLPGLQFDGSNDAMVIDRAQNGLRQTAFGQPMSIYMVAKQLGVINNASILTDGGGGWNIFLGAGGSLIFARAGAALGNFGTPGTSAAKTIQVLFNGASTEGSLNGGSKTTGNGGTNTTTALYLGGNDAVGSTGAANIIVYELVMFDRVLSGGEETSVLSYLQTKYAHY